MVLFMLVLKKKIYHCDIPLSKVTIHLETKNVFLKKINKFADFNYNLKDLLKHEVNKKLMKIFVTGASGFIGSRVATYFQGET